MATKSTSGWKIVFLYLFQYKAEIVLLSVLGLVSALANAFVPYIVGRFFDTILDFSQIAWSFLPTMPLWVFFLILLGLTQVIANTTDWILYLRRSKFSILLETRYISNGFSSLLRLPLSFHNEKKTGEVGSIIYIAANWLSRIISDVILELAPQFLSVIFGLIFAFFIQPLASIPLIVGIVLYVLILIKITGPAAQLQRKRMNAYGKAHGAAYDSSSQVYSIKKFTAEDYFAKSINRKFVGVVAGFAYRLQKVWGGVNFYQRIIVVATQLSVFTISVFFIQQGTMTIGELIALNGYAFMIFGPFVTIGHNWQIIQNGIVAVEKSDKMLTLPKEKYIPDDAVSLKELKGDVSFKNVSFSYKKKDNMILRNINLEIKAGEVVALVGESGVGKSTIIELIGGYYFATKGTIAIDGHDIRKINLEFLRNNIGVVPQEVALFNESVEMNIKLGRLNASKKEIREAAKQAHAHEFIERFPKKYAQIVGERGIKLSVGQKQRIAIARAILRNPKILILDEPTSALDAQTEKLLSESLEILMKGKTTIIIAHRLSTVRRADKIIVLKNGRIVEQGKHKDLIKKKGGVYQELYQLQYELD